MYYDFIRSCLAGLTPKFDSPDWSWEALIALAADEALLPALFPGLRAIQSTLPLEVVEFVSTVRELNQRRNRKMLSDVEELAALFNEVEIDAVFLKGVAYILSEVFDDCSERFLSDIDVLVPDAKLSKAVEALRKAGYVESDPRPIASIGHHYTVLYRPGESNYGVEIHRRIGLGSCSVLLPASELISQSRTCRLNGACIRIPSPEHLIIHHVAHSQIHHEYRERIWPSLRYLYDFLLLTRRFQSIDWSAIEKRFRHHRQYPIWALYAQRAQATFGEQLPFPVHEDWVTRVRGCRRGILRGTPALRRIDPIYIYRSSVLPRVRLLPFFLSVSGGREYMFKKLLNYSFYRRLMADVGKMSNVPPPY